MSERPTSEKLVKHESAHKEQPSQSVATGLEQRLEQVEKPKDLAEILKESDGKILATEALVRAEGRKLMADILAKVDKLVRHPSLPEFARKDIRTGEVMRP